MHFFLMSQGSFNPKSRFLDQKVCRAAHEQTDRHTHTHTHETDYRGHPFRVSESRIGPIIFYVVKGAIFSCFFGALFQYTFGDYCDNHVMRHIILAIFFISNNYDRNKYILFQDHDGPLEAILNIFSVNF